MRVSTQSDKKNLVFVDDDAITIMLVKRLLKDSIYNVNTFDEAGDAHTFITTNRVHVLIVDLRMPTMNGLEFLESLDLSARKTDIDRIIVQTGAEPEASLKQQVISSGYKLILKDTLLADRDTLNSLLADPT